MATPSGTVAFPGVLRYMRANMGNDKLFVRADYKYVYIIPRPIPCPRSVVLGFDVIRRATLAVTADAEGVYWMRFLTKSTYDFCELGFEAYTDLEVCWTSYVP